MSTSLLCACSDTTEGTTSDNSAQTESINSDTVSESSETEDNTDVSEDDFVDVGGTDLYIPSGFEEELAYGYYIYSKEFGNDTIYFNFFNHAWYSRYDDVDIDSYALEDVPDIVDFRFRDALDEVMDHYKETFKKTIDTNTTETINGLPFLIQGGSIHIEFREPEDTHDLKYVAYYTLYDNKYYEKVPTSIILFSDCNDAETQAELDRLAREIVNNTDWVIEY